jgi:hypothetical protein
MPLTIQNEPDDGVCITTARIFDMESIAAPIPAGELVRIIGVGVDESGDAALWSIAWNGWAYWCLPDELRPARESELQSLQEGASP